jgi:hypothetical protein
VGCILLLDMPMLRAAGREMEGGVLDAHLLSASGQKWAGRSRYIFSMQIDSEKN